MIGAWWWLIAAGWGALSIAFGMVIGRIVARADLEQRRAHERRAPFTK